MADIVTSRIFVDGEKGITAAKLNDIVASSVIQPSFYTSKPTASTADPTDVMLILKSGAYTQVPISTVTSGMDASQIWSVRLRSFNAVGNPNFEVDQRTGGNGTSLNTGFAQDRWILQTTGTMDVLAQLLSVPPVAIPGTNFPISQCCLRVTLNTQQATLGAGDNLWITQNVEGINLRELISDVHSVSLLVRSSVAGLTFGFGLMDDSSTHSLLKLCTIPTANTWILITLPNLPVWLAAATWNLAPGFRGYQIFISLGSGSTYTAPANDTWQNGLFVGAAGQSNFSSNPVNSTFDIAFVQHEPGPVCSTLMDKPFTGANGNLEECLRYYQKSHPYGITPGTAIGTRQLGQVLTGGTAARLSFAFPKQMAKTPTLTLYDASGAINAVYVDNWGDHVSVTGVTADSSGPLNAATFPTAVGAAAYAYPINGNWVADTGW